MGDRTIEACGNVVFEDLTNNVKAFLVFNTYKKSGYWNVTESGKKDVFFGMIYKTKTPIDPYRSYNRHYIKGVKEVKDYSTIQDEIGEKICDVEGSWLQKVVIDRKEYWNIDDYKPTRPKAMMEDKMKILASDSRFRDD